MSFYNVLAIFNEVQLVEVESVLNQMTLLTQGHKNQLEKAVEDYNYLLDNSQTTRGLTQQIILFLLDEASTKPEGIELFLSKLEVWLVIVENKKEQRIWAEVLNKYQGSLYLGCDEEILGLRSSLLDVLHELDDVRAERKKQKRFTQWQSQDMTWTEAPMQYQPGYEDYELKMKEYGQSFESPDSLFNSVPNLKEKFNQEQPSYESAFGSCYFLKEQLG